MKPGAASAVGRRAAVLSRREGGGEVDLCRGEGGGEVVVCCGEGGGEVIGGRASVRCREAVLSRTSEESGRKAGPWEV